MENKNSPAFPETETNHASGNTNGKDWHYGNVHSTGGLTKREWFAGMALQGICSAIKNIPDHNWTLEMIGEEAIQVADETLKQLSKPLTPMTPESFEEAINSHIDFEGAGIIVNKKAAADACYRKHLEGVVEVLEGMRIKQDALDVIDKYFDGPYAETINALLDSKITEIKALINK